MPKFYTSIDLNKNELKAAAIEPRATGDPSSPAVGQIYFDTNSGSSTYNRLLVRRAQDSTFISIPYSGSIVNADIASNANINVTKLLTTGTNAVTLSSIGAPTGTVSFNSQAINNVSTITTSGSVTVGGDLTVSGSTTTINTTDLNVKDKNIIIANVTSPDNDTADGAGITIKGLSDKTFTWIKATTSFTSSENVNLVSGKTYKINGTDVLSSTQVLGKTPGGSTGGDITTNNDSQSLTNKTYNGLTVSTTTGTLTIASGSTLATSGANSLTFTTTGTTSVTLPTSGTLATVPTGSNQSVATKYYTTVTFDAASKTVTHNLGTKDVIVQLYDSSDNQVFFDIQTNSTSQVTITNGTADNATYRVVVVG